MFWLLNKFSKVDIIGKIYISIILFIVIVATITVITRYKNAYIEETSANQAISINEKIN